MKSAHKNENTRIPIFHPKRILLFTDTLLKSRSVKLLQGIGVSLIDAHFNFLRSISVYNSICLTRKISILVFSFLWADFI